MVFPKTQPQEELRPRFSPGEPTSRSALHEQLKPQECASRLGSRAADTQAARGGETRPRDCSQRLRSPKHECLELHGPDNTMEPRKSARRVTEQSSMVRKLQAVHLGRQRPQGAQRKGKRGQNATRQRTRGVRGWHKSGLGCPAGTAHSAGQLHARFAR